MENDRPTRRIYSHAPLAQAVINLRFDVPSDRSPEDMRNMLAGAFAEGEPQLFPSPREAEATTTRPVGAVVRIRNARTVLYCTRQECVAMRLAPYESWDAFRPEFDRLWLACHSLWRDQRPMTLGLRYTNEFTIGVGEGELSDLFAIYPSTTAELGRAFGPGFRGLLADVVFEDGSHTIDVAVSDKVTSTEREVILDLDVSLSVPRDGPFDIGESLEGMHLRINRAFEASITDRTRAMIA